MNISMKTKENDLMKNVETVIDVVNTVVACLLLIFIAMFFFGSF